MFENINYSVESPYIGILAINREKVLNTLSLETVTELKEFIGNQLPNEDIRVLIITGAGKKAFVAGADISQMKEMNADEFRNYCVIAHGNFNNLQNLKIPVIAAINGYALGGGSELALACDIRIASENAKLGFPETKLGIFPCWGGSQRATKLLGPGKAKELIFTGEMISAQQALEIGMVEKVVTQEELMAEALSIAQKIAKNGTLAVGLAKEMINTGQDIDLQEGLKLELSKGIECFDSYDRVEGMSAFLEKRKAEFKGK